jgi:hypothetical protein
MLTSRLSALLSPSSIRKCKAGRGASIRSLGFGKDLEWTVRQLRRCAKDAIVPPLGELFSETNDNSVAILLTYGPRAARWRRRDEGGGVHGQRPLHRSSDGHQGLETTHTLS